MARAVEPRFGSVFSYLTLAGDYCMRLVRRGEALTEESAQKTIAVCYAIQAFRASISTTHLSVSGYADIAAGLVRTVWELQLRLARVHTAGEVAALAELFVSTNREIKIRQVSIAEGGTMKIAAC
jgi:hypothetical protein